MYFPVYLGISGLNKLSSGYSGFNESVSVFSLYWITLAILIGKVDTVWDSKSLIYPENPLDNAKTKATPIIPKLLATLVAIVLPFLVIKFLKDILNALKKDIEVLFFFKFSSLSSLFFEISLLESLNNSPSFKVIILVEYSLAKSALWVTIITNFSLEISFKISITWTLVLLSNAPVGSSAKIIEGLLIKDLAIATLCCWPPLNWLGFLFQISFNPTFSKAILAFSLLSFLLTPAKVKGNSTFSKIVKCWIKL